MSLSNDSNALHRKFLEANKNLRCTNAADIGTVCSCYDNKQVLPLFVSCMLTHIIGYKLCVLLWDVGK